MLAQSWQYESNVLPMLAKCWQHIGNMLAMLASQTNQASQAKPARQAKQEHGMDRNSSNPNSQPQAPSSKFQAQAPDKPKKNEPENQKRHKQTL